MISDVGSAGAPVEAEAQAVKVHDLKVWPDFFDRLADGSKTFEVRKDDRGFQRGDRLHLHEWQPMGPYNSARYTNRTLVAEVGFVFHGGFGCDLGEHVVLSLLNVREVQS